MFEVGGKSNSGSCRKTPSDINACDGSLCISMGHGGTVIVTIDCEGSPRTLISTAERLKEIK